MMRRGVWALLALVALPACLDPIVGSECAEGYALCRGACVAIGSCATVDATAEVGSQDDASLGPDGGLRDDASLETDAGEGTSTIDVAALDSNEDAGSPDESNSLDADQSETPVSMDAGANDDREGDAWVADDGQPLGEDDALDAPALPDVATGPTTVIDAALDGENAVIDGASIDVQPCVDCTDGGGGTDEGAIAGAEDDAGGEDITTIDGPLVCADFQSICGDQCVDLAYDAGNCGFCGNTCDSGVCNAGDCLVCKPQQAVCGRQCMNIATDPDNCGGCGIPCTSGLCSSGLCEAAGTGHAIVIGHDYLSSRSDMNRILGNAVFLWPVNPVHMLVYEGSANRSAIAGANAAIAQVANDTGRQSVPTFATTSADVINQLGKSQVFLIYSQEGSDDETLGQLGLDWSAALFAFVGTGGTVVLLDGPNPNNSGTSQILAKANLFDITRNTSATGDTCKVVAPGDALATGLPKEYLCEINSTTFTIGDLALSVITRVVEDSGQAVVVHKIF